MKRNFLMISAGLVVVLLVLVSGAGFWLQLQLQPVDPADIRIRQLVIAKGEALGVTANKLAAQGLIKQPQVFRYYVQLKKLDRQIQAGSYQLSANMTVDQIALALTEGTEDLWITLPEGWRNEEIAEYLAQQALPAFDQTEFLQLVASSEGKLFPDTYLIPKASSAQQIVSLLTKTYQQKVTIGLADQFAQSSLSPEEVLTLASIVQREGQGFADMQHVAGILFNRLDLGMTMQADATLQYLRGKDQAEKWWGAPSPVLKSSTSPYNTYLYPGLPPGPIANPGLDAIKAVLDPLPTDDLFYIHTPSGEVYFAKRLEEHNANVQQYLR
ncbi:MAG: endolytic transglycosylase MltG [Candidatus Pacebacteria bacterium CG_4_10_14_0_8_um_filter_43_12]|nr:MAG: endolytic transglycosylase MltG [Candidatus Pacebacteria bacterium CG_4_10_14_0_8_um_filter_43_12]